MECIRNFNRFELKYLVSTSLIEPLECEFQKYLIPDHHGDKKGWYALKSLYYDTDDYQFYREKIDGVKYRRKLRIRYYEKEEDLTEDDLVFVEIKQRIDRTTQKRRIPVTYKDALALCDERKLIEVEEKDRRVRDEIYEMLWNYDLHPTCITSYFRHARVGGEFDPGLRITFDTNIRKRTEDLDLSSKKLWEFMVAPDKAIMEIKVNDAIPTRLTELISDFGLRLIRISKYCQGLETAELVKNKSYWI